MEGIVRTGHQLAGRVFVVGEWEYADRKMSAEPILADYERNVDFNSS